VATLVENNPTSIQFMNVENGSKDAPTLTVQAGDWDAGDHVESGIIFDTAGNQVPMLSAADARKLAKWLTRAADIVEGVKNSDKKNKTRHRYEEDDDDDLNAYKR
jgi:hypothetical protein